MTVDESSSQDATLIDDDLVAALGFEPVTTIETTNGHLADDGNEAAGDADLDLRDDTEPISGFGVDEVREAVVEDEDLDEGVAVDEVAVDEVAVDEVAVDEVAADVVDVVEPEFDEVAVDDVRDTVVEDEFELDEVAVDDVRDTVVEDEFDDLSDAEIAFDEVALDEVALDAPDSDLDDADSGEFVSAGGSFFDLDAAEDETLDLDDGMDLDDVADEVGAEVGDSDPIDLIDLEAAHVDEAEIFDEAMDLADPDSVFAESGTPDSDVSLHPVTESVSLLDPALGEHTLVEESIAVGAAGTAAVKAESHVPRRQRRIRARKSRRVIRHIDPWSVLTFSVLFHMVVFAALLLSSVLVWNAAIASGMVENIESFIQELGDYETFEINADVMFRAAVVIAGMLTLASSVMVVLLTVVFNLISDLVGGIRVTVIEEETVRVPIDKKRSKVSIE